MKADKIVRADVLVIGGGNAGLRAALESSSTGAETLLVTKGVFGSSGTSSFHVAESAGFSAAGLADRDDTPAQHKADIIEAALGACSEELAELVAINAPRQVPFLEKLGVEYQKYKGAYLATKGCFASRRRSMKIKGHGLPIVNALKDEILRQGKVKVIEHTMAVSLLTEDNVCKGALFLSEEGSTEVRSKVVILGTGGAGQLFAQSLNPADVTGDGYALGYRAGAELVNMEFMQAGFGVIKPARTIFNAWIWALAPRIYDEDNIDFIGEYLPPGISVDDCIRAKENHYPFSSRDESKHLEISVKKRGNMGKKIFADLRHITAASISNNINLDQMWPITKNWMLACGVDVEAAPVQITVYAHAINGGLLINANGETTVSHLYAVGETAGGPHGADRLGGNMFASSQVFGEIAGRHAAETAMALEMETSPSQSEFPLQSEYPLQSGAALPDMQSLVNVRKRLQELASDELLIVRSARGLKRFLSEIETIDGELGGAPSDLRMRAYWFETKNLFLIGRLIGQSALFRTESRGSHYREDFPKMNSGSPEGGDEWGCALIHKIQDNKTVLKKQNL